MTEKQAMSAEARQEAFDVNMNLLGDDSSANKHHTRREEIGELAAKSSRDEISPQDKVTFGRWLEQRYAVLQNKVNDGAGGISKDDVIEAYSSAKWGNETKFLWHDMRMLKSVAEHFDRLAIAGPSESVIDKEDIKALLGAANVKRTSTEVTSNYPDGSVFRRTAKGLYNKSADGSISYNSGPFDLYLNAANGKGFLEVRMPIDQQFGSIVSRLEPMRVELERRQDGTWWGKDQDGSEMQLAVDDHSVRVTMSDMDMLVTSNGGFMRDPTDPDFAIFMNPDGSISMMDDGKSADIGFSDDDVTRVRENDGSNFYIYPGNMTMKVEPNHAMHIGAAGVVPRLDVSAAGEVTVFNSEGETISTAKPDESGAAKATLPDGRTVSRTRDGAVVITAKHPAAGDIEITINRDGKYLFSASALGMIVLNPPELKRPN